MMKNFYFAISIIVLVTACKNDKNKAKETLYDVEEVLVEQEAPEPEVTLGCYVFSKGENHVTFNVTSIKNDSITATLDYNYKEKDANSGTFQGTLNEDKLIGTYTFTSEGVESKREVAFKVNDSILIEGYGELNDSGTAFQDRATIKYTSTMPMVRTTCE
ncbi:hypothetical protein [Corallibacter sp.]|uniref:hypothetical protein n=1 Tax=Corallibacter sp. TaxID=2038084 RepID=UPI003AB8BF9B